MPYGYKTHLKPCDAERIRAASRSLRKARLLVGDFEDVVAEADTGDLIYFDPPYTVAHGNNGFIKYNEVILQWEDQLRLARVAHALRQAAGKSTERPLVIVRLLTRNLSIICASDGARDGG